MQSGGGAQGGHGRNMAPGPPSASASPSSSSSAVSQPHLGFDSMKHQQQQQQQLLQQQQQQQRQVRVFVDVFDQWNCLLNVALVDDF